MSLLKLWQLHLVVVIGDLGVDVLICQPEDPVPEVVWGRFVQARRDAEHDGCD